MSGYFPKVIEYDFIGDKVKIITEKPMPIGKEFADLRFQIKTKHYVAKGIFAMTCVENYIPDTMKTVYFQTCGFMSCTLEAEELEEEE